MKERSTIYNLTPHVGIITLTISDDTIHLTLACHIHKIGIAFVEKQQAIMGFQIVVEFAFGLLYAFKAAETQQMCTANIRYQATRRLCISDEFLYISGMTCTHFDHCYLMHCIEPEQRFGHTHIVVEVSLGMHHIVTLSKNSRNKLLGGGLSIGPRDANDRDIEPTAMLSGELLECCQAVVYKYQAVVISLGKCRFVNNGVGTALI